jgi:hypothetical protein
LPPVLQRFQELAEGIRDPLGHIDELYAGAINNGFRIHIVDVAVGDAALDDDCQGRAEESAAEIGPPVVEGDNAAPVRSVQPHRHPRSEIQVIGVVFFAFVHLVP